MDQVVFVTQTACYSSKQLSRLLAGLSSLCQTRHGWLLVKTWENAVPDRWEAGRSYKTVMKRKAGFIAGYTGSCESICVRIHRYVGMFRGLKPCKDKWSSMSFIPYKAEICLQVPQGKIQLGRLCGRRPAWGKGSTRISKRVRAQENWCYPKHLHRAVHAGKPSMCLPYLQHNKANP